VICSVMWIFALYLLALVAIIPIREYVYYYVYGGDPENLGDGYFKFTRELNNFTTWFIPYAPINNLTVVFQSLMEGWENYNGNELYLPSVAEAVNQNFKQWYMAFLPVIAGAASTWGYFRTFARKGAEKVGEASDTWFGYKVLIPIYGFSCYVFTGVFGVTFFLIAAGMYLAYAIYRKRFKIQKADIFSIVGTAAAAFIFMLVSSLVFRG
ncbi:MAG: hypothetical protein IJW21_05005, partial [Clostridia bacterium]|nr:hypothetical protein [Clostridia bacterium]